MLSNARHDFVAPLSANDVVSPNYLETLLKTLLDDPETSVAYSHATYVDDEGQPLVKQPAWAFYSALDDDPIERACLVIEKYCQATQFFALYRKSAVDRMQAQPFCYGGDHVFATEAAIYGKVAYRGDVDTKRSMPPGAGSANARRKHLINLFSLDHQRGLPNRSKIGRFENTTPIIDMFHGHLEMFRLADIDPKDRLILIKRGTRAFLERYQKGVTKDIQRFEKTAGALADSIDTENLATRMMIMNIIRKIDQCLFLQRNEGLVRIRHQLEETFR